MLTDWDEDDREQVGEIHLVVAVGFAARIEQTLQSELSDGSLQREKDKADSAGSDAQ